MLLAPGQDGGSETSTPTPRACGLPREDSDSACLAPSALEGPRPRRGPPPCPGAPPTATVAVVAERAQSPTGPAEEWPRRRLVPGVTEGTGGAVPCKGGPR